MTPADRSRNEWTTAQLHEYILRIMDEREKAHTTALSLAMRTADMFAGQLEKRLAALNQLRSEVLDDRINYVPKVSCEERYKYLDTRVGNVERWNARMVGIGLVLMVVIGAVSAVVGSWMK